VARVDIIHALAEALDADDYAAAKQLFEPEADYDTGTKIINGADAILAEFRRTSEWGRAHLDALEFSHEIEDEVSPFEILFIDVLRKDGDQIRVEHTMHVTLSQQGSVHHLRLETPPGVQRLVDEFFDRHGLNPDSATRQVADAQFATCAALSGTGPRREDV
jgi:hypothetical protein